MRNSSTVRADALKSWGFSVLPTFSLGMVSSSDPICEPHIYNIRCLSNRIPEEDPSGLLADPVASVYIPADWNLSALPIWANWWCFIRTRIICPERKAGDCWGWPSNIDAGERGRQWGAYVWRQSSHTIPRGWRQMSGWHRAWFVHYGLHILALAAHACIVETMLKAVHYHIEAADTEELWTG